VVPQLASVWYYFRELDFEHIQRLYEMGTNMAKGASLMTDTEFSSRIHGTAWPQHMNKVVAETMHENIKAVGLPQWSEADIQLAKATQKELGVPEVGLSTRIAEQVRGRESQPDEDKRGGGSDDIGDISWNVPTVSLSFPANFQAGPGHNWANAIPMATPIAHKGTVAGARVQAMTLLDTLMRPDVVAQAREYFEKVQLKQRKYTPLIRPQDQPAIHLNKAIMDKYRPEMRKFYYDSTKYKTYLDQLGIKYPTVRGGTTTAQGR
jgi:aminobenzoyl-glutamate utilization protein B